MRAFPCCHQTLSPLLNPARRGRAPSGPTHRLTSASAEPSTPALKAEEPERLAQALRCVGAPGGTRTPNLLIRSQMLYPLSHRRRKRPQPYSNGLGGVQLAQSERPVGFGEGRWQPFVTLHRDQERASSSSATIGSNSRCPVGSRQARPAWGFDQRGARPAVPGAGGRAPSDRGNEMHRRCRPAPLWHPSTALRSALRCSQIRLLSAAYPSFRTLTLFAERR